MQLTIVSSETEDVYPLEVEPDMSIAEFKGIVAGLTEIPESQQWLTANYDRSLGDISNGKIGGAFRRRTPQEEEITLKDGDVIQCARYKVPSRRGQGTPTPTQAHRESIRQAAIGDERVMDQIRQHNPVMADAIHDPVRFNRIWDDMARQQNAGDAERERVLQQLHNDPMNPENQAKIEDMIRQENVRENMDKALEHIPESFTKIDMLYVPVIVNGHPVKAFVDSGAQATIMSRSCAERCALDRLIDKSFAGMARGVGTAPILGRVHLAMLQIGGQALNCSFTVMDGKDVDLLLGLDMLRRHRACINLKRGVLEISDTEVAFLPEQEIPKNELQLGEPVIEGPGGTKIGGRSGAILPPEEEGQSAGASAGLMPGGSGSGSGSGKGKESAAAGGAAQPPLPPRHASHPTTTAGFPREHIDAVISLGGCTEQQAIQALEAAGGNVDVAAGMFFGD